MSIDTLKILDPITVIQQLTRKPTPGVISDIELKAKFDEAPEALRVVINSLIDMILLDFATTAELTDITQGSVSDRSLSDIKFDVNNKSTIQCKTTTNVGNIYYVSIPGLTDLSDMLPLCVKFNATSTGNISINPNGIGNYPITDYIGNPVANVKKNSIVTLRYDAVNLIFQLQGKGGGGNAIASQMLIGRTATTDTGNIVGTMANFAGSTRDSAGIGQYGNGDVAVYLSSNGYYTAGLSGNGGAEIKIPVSQSGLSATKIMTGQNVFGLNGTATADATATAATVLTGYTAYVGGNKITGTANAGKKYAEGSGVTNGSLYAIVANLPFTPSSIELKISSSCYYYNSSYGNNASRLQDGMQFTASIQGNGFSILTGYSGTFTYKAFE